MFSVPFIELAPIVLFFIGFYGLIVSKKIIKSIIFTCVMEMAVILFWVAMGTRTGLLPPIGHELYYIADPLPQALMLTAIIIGLAVTAVNLTMLISLTRQYKSTDWDTVKLRSQGEDPC